MNATATSRTVGDVLRDARNSRILQLHADGLSERAIADEVLCSRSTVWSVVQKAKAAAKVAGVGIA